MEVRGAGGGAERGVEVRGAGGGVGGLRAALIHTPHPPPPTLHTQQAPHPNTVHTAGPNTVHPAGPNTVHPAGPNTVHPAGPPPQHSTHSKSPACALALACRTRATSSWCHLRAILRGVSPCLSTWSTTAPADRRARQVSRCPRELAASRGDAPSLSSRFTSAPPDIRAKATST